MKEKKVLTQSKKMGLTPEIKALYFQSLSGRLKTISPDDLQLITQVFDQQFPALKKEAQCMMPRSKKSLRRHAGDIILYAAILFLILTAVLLALEHYANAEVNPDLLQAAQEQADASMHQIWWEGNEEYIQPIKKIIGNDGSIVLAQNAPRRIITFPNGELGLSNRHTMITVIQPVPTPVPTPRPRPTPLPTPIPKQETYISTNVESYKHFETRAVLPEDLTVDQLTAVNRIAENGVVIGQQQIGLEQYRIQLETGLARLQVWKNFTLWGFLASIPFLGTLFLIVRSALRGYSAQQQRLHDYKLKELETSERVIYDKVPENR